MAVMCKPEDALHPYIGVKMIYACPITYGQFCEYKNKPVPEGVNPDQQGYLVRYHPDNYESWSPKSVFESAYFRISQPTRITTEDINRFLRKSVILEPTGISPHTTLVHVKTPTGWDVCETASCVEPENYNPDTGRYFAISRIENKLLKYLGFVLQWARHGLVYKDTKNKD